MDKNVYTLNNMGPCDATGDPPSGLPLSESKSNQDNIDLAMFGKRPQLKVSMFARLVLLICPRLNV